jgi:Kef-type K+ transport system membrane component KefB
MEPVVVTFGLMIIAASAVALLAHRLKQPLLLGYVLAGILLGPAITGLVDNPAPLLGLVTDLGLIFLMFIIGLELDLTKIKDVGRTSAMIGILQVTIVTIVAATATSFFGIGLIQGIYLGLAASFSSTLVVVNILTQTKEINSLHGELVLGILVAQDMLAVIGLSLLGTLKGGSESIIDTALRLAHITLPSGGLIESLLLIANLTLFALVTYLFFKHIMPRVFKEAIASAELLFIVSLAIVLVLSVVANLFAFSVAVGAFLAGIALSTAVYSHEIMGRVKPIKDFFLLLFFVSLGMQIMFDDVATQVPIVLIILAGTMLLKPVVTFFVCKAFRYNNRTSFFTALHLAQASEFGLILIAVGITQGTLPASMLTGVVLVTIVTMVMTAYLIRYDERIYQVFKPLIEPLDILFGSRPEEHRNVPEKYKPQVIIIGVNALTSEAVETLHGKKRILVIDYNPQKIITYKKRGVPTICADALSVDLYKDIDFTKAETVVSVVHELASNQFILKKVHEASKGGTRISTIMSASTEDVGKKLYRSGATLVLMPDVMGRRMLSEIVAAGDPATIRNIGKVYYEELHKNFVFIREI